MINTPQLSAEHISLAYQNKKVLKNINIDIPMGKITALIGPNGSGKSTLLRILCGLIKPDQGKVHLNGVALNQHKAKHLAKEIAFLPQRSVIPDNYHVFDLLNAGRFPHQGLMKQSTKEDLTIIDWALEITDMKYYKNYFLSELSGGLQQRAWLAMILAQQTPIVILDEPSTYLDIKHQLQLLELVKALNLNHHKTIIWVLHDLAHAIQTSDYLFVLDEGELVAQGTPQNIINSNILNRTFDITAKASYFEEHISL